MKHATLTAFLLVGFGLSSFTGMLGGGYENYGKDSAAQQSIGNTAEMRPKETGERTAPRKTAENHGVRSCADTEESACPDTRVHLDK